MTAGAKGMLNKLGCLVIVMACACGAWGQELVQGIYRADSAKQLRGIANPAPNALAFARTGGTGSAVYQVDAFSTAADDGDATIAPAVGSGRWIKTSVSGSGSGGGGSAPTGTMVKTAGTAIVAGVPVLTDTTGTNFTLTRVTISDTNLFAGTITSTNWLAIGTVTNVARLNLGSPTGALNESLRLNGSAGGPVFSISGAVVGSLNSDGTTNHSWQMGMNGGVGGQYDTNHARLTVGTESRYIQTGLTNPQVEWYMNMAGPAGAFAHRVLGGVERWDNVSGAHVLSQLDYNVDQINFNSWDGSGAQRLLLQVDADQAVASLSGQLIVLPTGLNNGVVDLRGGNLMVENSGRTVGMNQSISGGHAYIANQYGGAIDLNLFQFRTVAISTNATIGGTLGVTGATTLGSLAAGAITASSLAISPSANTTASTISAYSVTGSGTTNLRNDSGTWNTTGAPTAWLLNLTNTASAGNSLFEDFQISGSSKWKVDRQGNATALGFYASAGSGAQPSISFTGSTNTGFYLSGSNVEFSGSGTTSLEFDGGGPGLGLHAASYLAWAAVGSANSTKDTGLKRSAAGVVQVTAGLSGTGTLSAATLIESASQTPASAAATGTAGTIAWDSSFLYVATAANTWKRVAIATW